MNVVWNTNGAIMIRVGQSYELEVVKLVDFGAYLDGQNLGQILLPRRFEPDDLAVGDVLNVFLYLDSEDRPVATTQRPRVKVGQFAYLKVKDVNQVGAFLDWGLDKDLLVPFGEQHRPFEVGQSYIVYVYVSHVDQRITASSKIDRFLDVHPHSFTERQAVDLIIANTTDLGFKAIVNHSHWGVLYQNEVFERLSFGQSKKGFIKRVRPDGKIDLILQSGRETRDKATDAVESFLNKNEGFAPFHDKSSPEAITKAFGVSKNAFKKAIGGLYKQGKIRIENDGIHQVK